MQLGFVIDHSRCIGCHACTVACKSENSVPLGSFRTWVKYTETGVFPKVRRSFAVLRCNQCTDAPCVTICPVRALEKRDDGIVDVDPKACIGCKACMQGCPYDALYVNEDTGTAEKCHFCAHRTDLGLAPACAVACPTEAIIPGDFHDPASRVSELKAGHALTARKVEAGTGPNVLYREADPAGLDPSLTSSAGGHLWSQLPGGPQLEAQEWEALERRASARTVYDVPRRPLWGLKISAYLFTKSVASGVFLAGLPLLPPLGRTESATTAIPALALVALAVTGALLLADLKRPDRFMKLFLRPNWSSWLARGSFIIAGYGTLAAAWLGLALLGIAPSGPAVGVLLAATAAAAVATAAYTGWLFAQARGRPLWMSRGLWLHLVAQAVLAGGAALLLVRPGLTLEADAAGRDWLLSARGALLVGLGVHLLFVLFEGQRAPRRREAEHARAVRLLTRGPLARQHWLLGLGLGVALPALLLAVPDAEWAWRAGAACALAGLLAQEDSFVRAGQALPIS